MTRVLLMTIVIFGWTFTGTAAAAKPPPPALPLAPEPVRSVMDLTAWNFADDGVVSLTGQWRMYWRQLLTPDDFADRSAHRVSAFVPVPGIWNDYRLDGQRLPNSGYATYRLIVKLSPAMAAKPKSLYMPSVATAYRLWVNGELAAENGRVGTSRLGMTPRNAARVVTVRSSSEQLDLVIQVSNFVQRKGGLWKTIKLGTDDQIARERERNVVYALAFSFGLYVMGLYHLFLYLPRRFDRSPLWFALLCFAVGTRTLFVGETLAVHWFPAITWELATRLEYLSANSAMIFLLLFISLQYPREARIQIRNLLLALEVLFIGFVLTTSAAVYTQAIWLQEMLIVLDLIFILHMLGVATMKRRDGARIHLIGLSFILLAVLNDIFMYGRWIHSIDLSPLGLFGYLFAQSVLLSHKFARSFAEIRNLSDELHQANITLEHKIDERTSALRRANASLREVNGRLSQVEDARRRLLSNITHEMGNPLTSLQGYLHAMEDGLVREDEAKIFGLIRQKIGYLDQMIQDLVELSRLETMQILFQFHPCRYSSFVRQLIEKYERDVTRKGIRLVVWQGKAAGAARAGDMRVRIDPLRMEQVFVNLLFNAVKFTPGGGTIALDYGMIGGEADEEGNSVGGYAYLSVSDTGPGIASEDLPYVFERFFKGSVPCETDEGGGLGLSIAKEITERHGGSIEAASVAGEGSTFWLKLPVWRENGVQSAEGSDGEKEGDREHDGTG